MAAGDITVFDQFRLDVGNKIHNLGGDTWKLALITSATTPAANTPAPHFGGTGTTNLATNQVAAGGNYVAGGAALTTVNNTLVAGKAEFKADKYAIAQNAANPTNARWGIIYNATDANKRAAAFVDLGGVKDLTATAIELRWNNIDGNGVIFRI